MKIFPIAVIVLALAARPSFGESAEEKVAFFEKKVRPVLMNRCYACHSADTKPAGGLRVDDRNGLLTGGDSGPGVIPGDPENSTILKRIRHADAKRKMPKEGEPVTSEELENLTAWIRDGVAWPAEKLPASFGKSRAAYERLRSRHWAFQPLRNSPMPTVASRTWPAEGVSGDIDRFVLAKLEAKKLLPVADSNRVALIRRVSFDLTGLPPTPAGLDAFLTDRSPNALPKLVDRLLASPHFGERWGRHWLDVARYGESSGPSRNIPYPHAWRYRDYVIDSVNRDVPVNRFIQEQVAGDLLPAATTAERDRLQIATGFLALGPKDVNQRFRERFLMDNVDEKIDTVTKSTLGLTVSCARCHDHKFDPVPAADYYALAGIFTSTEDGAGVRNKMGGSGLDYFDSKLLVQLASYVPNIPAGKVAKLEAEVAAAKKEWEAIRGTPEGLALGPNGKPKQQPYRLKYERVQLELLSLTDPASYGFAVHGVREAKSIGDTAIRIRGEAERLGPIAPRGFLTAFAVPGAPAIDSAQSGRLQLAQWLTSDSNPLTPRVAVNRVWKHLFGQGLVTTVDNFGITGDFPSHPELLDYLAAELIRGGWSIKQLVRNVVLSHSYRLSSGNSKLNREIDPANRLIWRHSPRRLDAEEIRDGMLAAAGRLQLDPPLGSPAQKLKMIEMPDNGPESRTVHQKADEHAARSIYLPLLRGVVPRSLEAFDPVTQSLVTGQRETTTVPSQALFLLNSSFVRAQSLTFAEHLLAKKVSERARIQEAYRFVHSREPNQREQLRALRFLADYGPAFKPLPAVASLKVTQAPAGLIAAGELNDDERTAQFGTENEVHPQDSRTAAWMALVQSLFASAEFRFLQ